MPKLRPSDVPARIAAWPRAARILVPLACGALVALGHEAWMDGIWPVLVGLTFAFVAFPQPRRFAMFFGWLMGVGYFGVTLRWIIEPFLVDIARHGWMAPFAILLMAGGMALFWGAAAWLARFIAPNRPSGILWFVIALAAAEFARGHVLSGFPWALLSNTTIGLIWDVWLAWVGPYGTSGLILLVTGGAAYCLHRGWTLVWPALVGVLFATVGMQAVTPQAPAPTSNATLRLIQPNAPQHLKWDRDYMSVFFNRALDLTEEGAPADVVIWPETSIPTLLNYADPLIEQMSRAARGGTVVAGIQRREGDDYYNSAIVIDGPQTVSAIADKSHLVPFGEYIPLAWILEPLGLGTLVDQVAGFRAGTGTGLVEIDGLGLARILICYEGIFPEDMQVGDVRPEVLVIITNDAWFGTGPGPRQHLVQAQSRAIEQGLPVVRAANTGISAVIDARGDITDRLPLNAAGHLDARVPAALPPTLYARMGDWPLLVLLLLCIGAGVACRKPLTVDGAPPQV